MKSPNFNKTKMKQREELNQHVAKFLENGGSITQEPIYSRGPQGGDYFHITGKAGREFNRT